MPSLRVRIVRFVDEEPQPGIVEAEFRDAYDQVHRMIDKVPIFTVEMLWSDSEYPQAGDVDCEILERMRGSNESNLVRIATLEDTFGQSEFVVNEVDISDE